ncbi:kinesin-like protein KIN-12B [Phoenix dactylifera]|uniref:Kinesin-like protein KIN-12B n=1 Tax=Phoenix dactylifera TaxID=42345 RepID=A0A8B7CZ94_PHODC|nr:kinesin-like protein KIN-12B [Phoenix dactylifera]
MKAHSHQRSARVPPSETLTPHKHRPPRIPKENVDPGPTPPESSPFRSPSVAGKTLATKNRSPLPPRPPLSSNHGGNPLKRKLSLETLPENGVPASMASDSGVQVIVRMRPLNKEEEEGALIVQKISPNSISILDHAFTFDSVADSRSTQEDIFHLVGLPLVENCLAGFNSSIFAYGQTGSGKTYTMWGPPSALSEDASSSNERGLTPRVFEQLFSRIDEEQAKHSDNQLNYQCRCSFLEIYNEQITDLLDPTQRNLLIREDVRTGVYVDCLTEEYVCTVNDVIQLLTKGLTNRRIGATSINAESSRSHCVFTCIVECRAKNVADGRSSLRTSRINLVDLAGSERQKQTGAAGERLKEAGNINRSLSQLGNLINILAEVSQSGKQRHIPYRDSRLTFLLQESLGGNAKLAILCAISPSQSCKSETLSTLRFAQRAKVITNKAVVNEITQDDVNVLREQIRQLKDELLRMKTHGTQSESSGSYSTGWNARRSLNLLRMSLNRPRALPVIKDDSDEEMEIDENDVEKPHFEAGLQPSEDKVPAVLEISKEKVLFCKSDNRMVLGDTQSGHISGSGSGTYQVNALEGRELEHIDQGHVCLKLDGKGYCSTDDGVDKPLDGSRTAEMNDEKIQVLPDNDMLGKSKPLEEKAHVLVSDPPVISSSSPDSIISPSSLSVPCRTSPVLQSPKLSTSPIVENRSRKSLRTSSSKSASQNNILENVESRSGDINLSFADTSNHNSLNASIMQTCKKFLAPTEHLAASLHHGLQIMDNHRHSSALRRSSFMFSIRPVDVKPMGPVIKVDAGVQTLVQESEIPGILSTFICNRCKNGASTDEHSNNTELQLVLVDGSMSSDKQKMQVPKAVEKVLAGAIRREMAVEDQCAKQAAEIAQLNRLVQQYKHERECSAVIAETREDKISRLESLMDGILPTEDFMEEEFVSLMNEHKLLNEKYENHPEVLRVNIELKRVQDELDRYRNFCDMGERDVLMGEIQDLKGQVQYYMSSSMSTPKPNPLLLLADSIEPNSTPLSPISELAEESADEKQKQEMCDWDKVESKWISISEELRRELEASRSLAEKWKRELDSEKKCTEELKEALQTAMQGHAHILEQYAELQEKHIALLGRHRKISDGIEDVKRAAAKAGVKGSESRFIDSLAAEISVLRAEREKERRYWRDENKGLQAQLRDTAEAVQAAGEVLVRLKEAEETAAIAQKRVLLAEQETEKAYQEIDTLKKTYEKEILLLNQFLVESRLPKESPRPAEFDDRAAAEYDVGGTLIDQRCIQEFEPLCHEGDNGFSKGTDPNSWFSGYDRCNI